MSEPSSRTKLGALAELVLHRLPLTLAALLLLAAIAINFANVIARYLFLAAIYWADEAMIFLVIWSIFLAAVAVTYDGSQLTMDLFSTRLPPRWQRVLDATIAGVSFLTYGFMAWQALTVVRLLIRNDQRSIALDIPIAIPHAALLVGFILCAIVVVLRLFVPRRPAAPDGIDDIAKRAG